MQHVVLVDAADQPIGTMEKMEAHQKGLLHRAFSIFIFDEHGRLLIQQRTRGKYHSGGLWTNSCCSHPLPGESLTDAGKRRLEEEMGFTTALTPLFSFLYHVELDGGLIEHELDHVLIGHYDGTVHPNPEEVMDYRWADMTELKADLEQHPELYTSWFRIIVNEHSLAFESAFMP